jgi:hypothetical protein
MNAILCGMTLNASAHFSTFYSKQNLHEVGSGCQARGADAAQQIAVTAISPNVGLTASGIMSLMQEKNEKNNVQ